MPIKIGFILLSNSKNPIPSTRIAVLNMLPFLRAANFEPHIVFEPEYGNETPQLDGLMSRIVLEDFQIIYFQKIHGSSAENLAQQLSVLGIKTVYGVCDLVNEAMATATDITLVVTDYLKSLYPQALQAKISVVHDGIEHPEHHKISHNPMHGSRNKPLHAVLVTSSSLDKLPILNSIPNWLKISIVGRYPPAEQILQSLQAMRWQFLAKPSTALRIEYLQFLAHRRIARIAWHPTQVYKILQQADIGIIPIDAIATTEQSPPAWQIKSENRLTMKMCVGLPVIATPIPAYEPVIRQGKNGFLAHSIREWHDCLDSLRDPLARKNMGELARDSVLIKYSKQEQAKRLIMILNQLLLKSSF
jgi:glycosyltransferase involved in cell wall biosynthesis